MIIYQIRVPKKQDVEAFVKFVREESFPAVHKGATRVGKVTDVVLLQAEPEGRTTGCNSFGTWVGLAWRRAGVRLDDETVAGKLESFKARIKRLGFYSEVAAWHEGDVA